MIHVEAPSPIVRPLLLVLEQRQSNVGVVVHLLVGKLLSRNEAKHARAQVGMKFVSSFLKEIDATVGFEYANSIIRRT